MSGSWYIRKVDMVQITSRFLRCLFWPLQAGSGAMRISGWGLLMEGDLDDDGFLVVKTLFPDGPVALLGASAPAEHQVREGDVLLAVEDTDLRGLSERDVKRLVADSRCQTLRRVRPRWLRG